MTGQELKAWRKKHRYTQEKLCLLLGIGHSTLRYWESGKHKFPTYLRLALAYIDEKKGEIGKLVHEVCADERLLLEPPSDRADTK